MALFLGVHKLLENMDDKQVSEGYGKYKNNANAKGLHPLFAVYSLEKGFAYCQTEASSAQEVWDAHKEVQVPLEDVIEVKRVE